MSNKLKFVCAVIVFFSCGLNQSFSQLKTDPTWKITSNKSEIKAGDQIELTFNSQIEKNWYMYSSDMDPNIGPIVASFDFKKHASYQLIGKIKPVGAKHHYEEIWPGDVSTMTGKAEFRQKVKVLSANPVIKVSIEFQECSEITGMCMPPYNYDLQFNDLKVIDENAIIQESTTENSTQTSVDSNKTTNNNACEKVNMSKPNDSYINDESLTEAVDGSDKSLLGFMLYAFLFGLAALLTPCVFPMIPMTVTFFTKNQENGKKNAIFYGLSIVFIYTIIGTAVSIVMGPDFANWLSTHWLPNLLFFAIFVVFGVSFLGLFEITLPTSFVNSVNKKSNVGGYLGVFFLAFTMVLVSFSCTGPLVGNVLIQAFGGNYLRPIAGMFAFSMAFAIPFTLFAIFPQWLSNLPKSGGWLNSVKVVLGFIELGLALKFFSVADTVYHWGILNRDIYIVLWIILSLLTGIYILGKLKFSHDSELSYISVTRLFFSLPFFAFALYLAPGIIGAPLKAISGYLPPQHTLSFDISNLNKTESNKAKHSDFLHIPHGIQGYFDYCEAIENARKLNKPLFLDFTGHGCVNCREMEANVWSDPQVLKLLKEDYVVVSLYADENKLKYQLPESEWYTSALDGKVKKTIGKQVLDMQIRKFNFNAQPLYVLIDANENLLAKPRTYDRDVQHFIDFLEKGKKVYNKIQSQ